MQAMPHSLTSPTFGSESFLTPSKKVRRILMVLKSCSSVRTSIEQETGNNILSTTDVTALSNLISVMKRKRMKENISRLYRDIVSLWSGQFSE